MGRRRFSLATGMFSILLLAADLAAFRHLPWPALDFRPLHLTLGLLPMLNVLAILGYRVMRDPGARSRWVPPLVIFASLAMLAHVAWVELCPDHVDWICRFPDGMFFRLCQAYRVPDSVGVSSEGYSYFRYYPAVVLLKFGVLQLIAAGVVVACYLLAARFRDGRRAAGAEWPSLGRLTTGGAGDDFGVPGGVLNPWHPGGPRHHEREAARDRIAAARAPRPPRASKTADEGSGTARVTSAKVVPTRISSTL